MAKKAVTKKPKTSARKPVVSGMKKKATGKTTVTKTRKPVAGRPKVAKKASPKAGKSKAAVKGRKVSSSIKVVKKKAAPIKKVVPKKSVKKAKAVTKAKAVKTGKKAPARKAPVKKAAVKKVAPKRVSVKKAVVKKATVKKRAPGKTAAKKAAPKKATQKTATERPAPTKRTPTRKAPVKKVPSKISIKKLPATSRQTSTAPMREAIGNPAQKVAKIAQAPTPHEPAAPRKPIAEKKSALKERFQIEFYIRSAPTVLYDLISTPSGFSEWYCTDVNVKDDLYTFMWDGEEESAALTGRRAGEVIRFHWLDDEDPESFFEFRIRIDAMTNDVALIVTDHAWPHEIETAKALWQSQIAALMRVLGA